MKNYCRFLMILMSCRIELSTGSQTTTASNNAAIDDNNRRRPAHHRERRAVAYTSRRQRREDEEIKSSHTPYVPLYVDAYESEEFSRKWQQLTTEILEFEEEEQAKTPTRRRRRFPTGNVAYASRRSSEEQKETKATPYVPLYVDEYESKAFAESHRRRQQEEEEVRRQVV